MYATILTVALVIGQVRAEPGRWEKWHEEVVVAETIWTNGIGDGDFNNAGNWTGGVPAVGNTPAIFDGTSQTPPTTNLDRGADVFRLITSPNYRGNIGSSGSPLKWAGMTVDTTTANIRGTGAAFLSITGSTKDVVVESTNLVDACTITTPGGSLRYLVVLRGACTLQSTGSFVVNLAQVIVRGNQSHLTIQAIDGAELAPDLIDVHGGVLVNQRILALNGDTIRLSVGRIEQTGVLETNARVHQTGGVFEYNPSEDVSGDAPHLVILDGIFDAREAAYPIGVGAYIKGPSAVVLGDIQESFTPTLDLTKLYP